MPYPLAARRVLGPLAFGTATAVTATGVEDVVWTSLVNAIAVGNTITKTSGAIAWNAGGVSSKAIQSGDGYVEWTAGDPATQYQMCGLSNGNTDVNYTDIDFAIYQNGGTINIYRAVLVQYRLVGSDGRHGYAHPAPPTRQWYGLGGLCCHRLYRRSRGRRRDRAERLFRPGLYRHGQHRDWHGCGQV